MSRDPRDWQADMESAHTARHEGRVGIVDFNNILDALFYWIQQAKQLQKDKADLLIQKYADANNYQVQAVEIGELKKQLEKAEEREQKLKEELEDTKRYLSEGLLTTEECCEVIDNFLAPLYPLNREDNGKV